MAEVRGFGNWVIRKWVIEFVAIAISVGLKRS
jgi:hypothetical protein